MAARRQLIVVVALQRSGTTAFAQALAQHPLITNFGEIFHSARGPEDSPLYANLKLNPRSNFFRFKQGWIGVSPRRTYPSFGNREAMLDAFLDHLFALTGDGWAVADIKYNSWHHFETVWSLPSQAPKLIGMLRERGAIFVHIRRRDLLARYASERIAFDRGQYHVAKGEEAASASIVIPIEQAEANIEASRAAMARFDEWLAPAEHLITADYEDLFVDGRIADAPIAALAGFTGLALDPASLPLTLGKATPDPGASIRNWAELRERFF